MADQPACGNAAAPAGGLRVDPQLQSLIPPLTPDERYALEQRLLAEGCQEALIVWRDRSGAKTLVDGHNRYAICRQHGLAFRVEERLFPHRQAVEAYIVGQQLCRRNLSPDAASYLRGLRYLAERAPRGGVRRGSNYHIESLKNRAAAEQLAEQFQVASATVYRDAQFAHALNTIVQNCGAEARPLLLARGTGVTRAAIQRLSKLRPAEQQRQLAALKITGAFPRAAKDTHNVRKLPREYLTLAARLVSVMKPAHCRVFIAELRRLLRERR